jgi:MFS family permease
MQNPLIAVLKIPSFVFLLISEFFSQFAMNLLNFILLIVVFQISSSNLAVAGVVLAFTLPSILFGILAGVYVDKWNKKNVLIYTNILRALAAIPLIFISNELFLIYIICFIISVITQFFVPAETPIIPLLVPKHLLLSANALFSMGIYGSIIVAYALSGPLLLVIGTTEIFILITIMFAISAFFAFLIKLHLPKNYKINKHLNIKKEVHQTLILIKGNKRVYNSILLLIFLQTLILIIAVIGPGYAQNVLNLEVEKFPLLFVTPAVIGMSVGAILIGNFLHTKPKGMIAKLGLLTVGIVLLLFTNLSDILNTNAINIMIILALIIGFAFSLIFVPSNTIIQEETTDEQRGKIYGSLNTFTGLVSLIPVLGVGVLADNLGVATVITCIGIGIIIVALIRIFKFK